MIAISVASFAASSGRPPLVNCSIESRLCLIIDASTCCDSASGSDELGSRRFSINRFFNAVVISRSVVVRSPSRAFMAVMVCAFTRASNVSLIACFSIAFFASCS